MPFFPWMSTGSERSLNSFGRDQDQTIARASRSQLEAKLYLDINQCTNIQMHKKNLLISTSSRSASRNEDQNFWLMRGKRVLPHQEFFAVRWPNQVSRNDEKIWNMLLAPAKVADFSAVGHFFTPRSASLNKLCLQGKEGKCKAQQSQVQIH